MDVEESLPLLVVCRICLLRRNDNECVDLKLDESLHAKLSSFAPQMNLNVTQNPVICTECSTELSNAFAFKEKCVETEYKLHTYISNSSSEKINLLIDVEKILLPIKCEQIYVKEELIDDTVYECAKCNLNFNDKSSYNLHITSHNKSNFSCGVCGKVYKSVNMLNKHSTTHTNQETKIDMEIVVDRIMNDPLQPGQINGKKRSKKPEPALLCSTCGQSCTTQKKLRMHMRNHMEKPLKCNICDFRCKHKSSLKVHKRVHAGDITDDKQLETIYNCDICNQPFYDKNYLHKHLKIHGEKSFACDMCGKLFNNKGDLGKHRRIHTGEKPYECKICGVKFRVSASLIRHTRAHTGEKPYVCETCGKCFNQKYHLNSHMNIHSGVKPYGCDTCDKTFSHKATLDVHIVKKHAGGFTHKCSVCFRCFSSEGNLSLHKESHQN